MLANFGTLLMARSSLPMRLLRSIEQGNGVTDVFLGSSVMEAAVDPSAFMEKIPASKTLNLALGGTAAVEHYLFLLAAERLKPKRITYGFYDTQLTDPSLGHLGATLGYRSVVYYLYPDTAQLYYAGNDGILRAQMALASHVPMYVFRMSVWGRVALLRQRLRRIGVHDRSNDPYGMAARFARLEQMNFQSFPRIIAVANGAPLNPAIQGMLSAADTLHASMFVIAMPMTTRHRMQFYDSPGWRSYLVHVDSLVTGRGGRFIDASDWIPDSEFSDALHITRRGSAEFSSRLAAMMQK